MAIHKVTSLLAALAALTFFAPSSFAQKGKDKAPAEVQVTGEVVDIWCYVDHKGHGAKHHDCAVACVEAGNPIGIVDGNGKVYLAMGAKKHQPGRDVLLSHMADHVMVTGHVAKMGSTDVIYVSSIVEMGGFCPVAYKMAGKAVPGHSEFSSNFDGKLYYFSNAQAKTAFDKSPAGFVPAMGGRCIVCKVKMHEDIAGDPRIFSVYNGKTYLFAGADQKKAFDEHPGAFLKKKD